jgi:hypothetical protein
LTSIYPANTQIGLYAIGSNSESTLHATNDSCTRFVIDKGNLDNQGGKGVIGISTRPVANPTSNVTGVLGVAGRTTFTELLGESVGLLLKKPLG